MIDSRWIFACLAPHAVAPHPNFRSDILDGPAALALVTELRLSDVGRSRGEGVPQYTHAWEEELVDAARKAVIWNTFDEGLVALEATAGLTEAPLGARVAAALYGSMVYGEREDYGSAVALVERALVGISEVTTQPTQAPGSLALARAALLQQAAFRSWELGDLDAAASYLESSALDLKRTRKSDIEVVALSSGIDLTALQLHLAVGEDLNRSRSWLLARVEGFESRRPLQLVRLPPTLTDARIGQKHSTALSAVADEEVRADLRTLDRTVTIGARDAVEAETGSALLISEFCGDVIGVSGLRATRAKLLLTRGATSDQIVARKSVQLLRQARDTKAVRDFALYFRSEGPDGVCIALIDDVLRRGANNAVATDEDLAVLSTLADYLTEETAEQAARTAFAVITSRKSRDQVPWKLRDNAFAALAKIVPSLESTEEVVAWLRPELDALSPIGEEYVDSLSRLADELLERGASRGDWSEAIDSAREARDQRLATGDGYSYRDAIDFVESGDSEESLSDPGAADEAVQYATRWLTGEVTAARGGRHSLGSFDGAVLALRVAQITGSESLWIALGDYLCDEHVWRDQKRRALRALTEDMGSLPTGVAAQLRENYQRVLASRSESFFSGPVAAIDPFPEAFRLGVALGRLDEADIVRVIAEQCASDDPLHRLEGTKSALVAARTLVGPPSWSVVTLVGRAFDADPLVRAEAAYGLASLNVDDPAVSVLMQELLHADGLDTPLRALHGLQRKVAAGVPLSQEERAAVDSLASSSHVRVVRLAALYTAELADAPS